MLAEKYLNNSAIWFNAHAFAEHVLCGGKALPWSSPTEFAEVYKKLQGMLDADRLSVPLMGFLDDWISRHPHVLQTMSGKNRVRFAIKRFLTNPQLRSDMSEWMTVCCAMVDAEIVLEIPSNAALISWAHVLANPNARVEPLTELDIDSTSVYLADTVRQLKPAGIAGVVTTLSDADLAAGACVDLYLPLANVAANYHWQFAFRKPVVAATFASHDYFCLGDDACSSNSDLVSLPSDFWRSESEIPVQHNTNWVYSELPAFSEPDVVRANIALLRAQ
ncbi:hypothetical protein [Zhongshania sp. BJYM1]|uniref:hypothetical protein n=1 Tax=Zhongshania aquatica TaxID=2965069 RepID=UPI0022B2E738|nr:hypothetical protein [Marortus sp. BJYM1]